MLGSLAVDVVDGVARVAGTDTIAGSTLTQDAALRLAVSAAGATLPEAVAALTSVPAAALGLSDRLGRIAPGYAADLVALSPRSRCSGCGARASRCSELAPRVRALSEELLDMTVR